MKKPLLEINNLSVYFKMNNHRSVAIKDLSLKAYPGEILAIVGASGSGKSVLAHSILGLLPRNAICSGEIIYNGRVVDDNLLYKLRGKEIAFIPQNISYLNPLVKVGKQVRNFSNDFEAKKKQKKIFRDYGLGEAVENLYPFQLSGGMARRVLISMAVMENPNLIIADEPTPGLDVVSAKKTMEYFKNFAYKNKAVIIITHDIELAINYSDKVAIFYAGEVLELTKAEYFKKGHHYLRHPYTKALYRSLPSNDFMPIEGFQPVIDENDKGCVFRSQCKYKQDICDRSIKLQKINDEMVKCNVDFGSS